MNLVSDSLRGYKKKEELDTAILLENLAAYISLLRLHIHREENVFYPLVENIFSEGEKEALIEQFNIENQKLGSENIDKNQNIVQEMGKLLSN